MVGVVAAASISAALFGLERFELLSKIKHSAPDGSTDSIGSVAE
jgi:hypothetical protein